MDGTATAPRGASRDRRIGEWLVGPIGLGAMPMSLEGRPDRQRALRTIHAALDAGVRLIDTADAYSLGGDDTGHNERLVAEALRTWSGVADDVLVATKGGHVRPGDGSWLVDGRPEHLRAACEASLRALGVEAIGLYQFHRPDPAVPFAESVGAMEELRNEGKVRMVGISNAHIPQIEEACRIVPLASVQNELSPSFRSSLDELARCGELGVTFLAWAPLGGAGSVSELGARNPRFAEVAERHGATAQQVALAWILALGHHAVPIPGASRPESVLSSVAAADLALDADDLAALDDVAADGA